MSNELIEIWELFKERYRNPKKTIKQERLLFWKLKYSLDRRMEEGVSR